MNLIRIGFSNFIRTKSNIILLIMLVMCLAFLETTVFYKTMAQNSVDGQIDKLSSLVFSVISVMTVVIVLIIMAILPIIAMLKLKDSSKFISLLKAIGYTNMQITIMQSTEYFFLMLTSFIISLIISIASIKFVWKILLHKSAENMNLYIKNYIYSDVNALISLLAVYFLIFLTTSFEIKRTKPLYFNKA